ncbi:hypothetical protein [Sphingomonas panni]|uniref:hypothetical protein n=1 Tax=Sphingomonas panni TaxID=237612 RepID=UPI001F5BDF57|nr:hypothetical protein [Sphingomonas panni]
MSFHRSAVALVLLATSGTLVGCTDPKEPSADAFRPALETLIRDHYCAAVDVMPYEIEGEGGDASFPVVTSPKRGMAGPGSDGRSVAMLDALAQAGLATRTESERPARWKGAEGAPFVRQPLLSYAPTEKGAAYLRTIEHQATREKVQVPSFCLAKGEVVEVVRWTDPVDVPGSTVSRVTYRYRGADPAPFLPASEREEVARTREGTTAFGFDGGTWRPINR